MADVIQEVMGNLGKGKVGGGLNFAMPNINTYDAVLIVMVLILGLLMFTLLYKFFVYKIKILELEDRGRGALVAKVLVAKKIVKNGIPRYIIWGKKNSLGKPLEIMASSTDNIIPLKLPFMNIFRDIVLMHKDKNGDYRPWKVFTSKDQIDINKYIYENEKTGNKAFQVHKFLDDFFPNVKIDNLKMRGWHVLNTKETFNIYQDPKELARKKAINIMIALFVIFALCIGAYMFLS